MKKEEKGVLTLYLALIIPVLLSLILTLFWGARVSSERMKTDIVVDIAGNSALAEYNRELRRQYGLLMIDTAYDKGSPEKENLDERLDYYFEMNLEGSREVKIAEFLIDTTNFTQMQMTKMEVPEYTLAGDNNEGATKRQIFAYMEAEPVEGLVGTANLAEVSKSKDTADGSSSTSSAKGESFDVNVSTENAEKSFDLFGKIGKFFGKIADEFSSHKSEEIGNSKKEDVDKGIEGPTSCKQILSDFAEGKIGILNLACSDKKFSDASFDKSSVYTGRSDKMKGTGLADRFSPNLLETGILFNLYMMQDFGYYDHEKEKSHLSYQIEYLVGEQSTDRGNIEIVARWICAIRFGMNCIYLLSATPQAEEINFIAAAFVGIPVIGEIICFAVKIIITIIWAFMESANDIKILFDKGKVPLVKTPASWKTSLKTGLMLVGGKNATGLTYGQYLFMLILVKELNGIDAEVKDMMDIMELDIRKVKGYENFRIDGCVDCFTLEAEMQGETGKTFSQKRYFGYEGSS
ncbi:DUF5702 domain-containing protein [Butyrivibrio sp. NC3005]|uniref:DUF5702 domain-containing protein n=1 Tax=Butyrivibrio sp. NC3005 TaxID=1280685 RepID=UPI00041F1169|nr:DUF5702 domain-containing protein [Butyrivibrio sp. NC3005]